MSRLAVSDHDRVREGASDWGKIDTVDHIYLVIFCQPQMSLAHLEKYFNTLVCSDLPLHWSFGLSDFPPLRSLPIRI